MIEYSVQSPEQVAQQFNTSLTQGLTAAEVDRRQKQYGPHEIIQQEASWLRILVQQWQSPFIYLLFCAALIAFFITKDYGAGWMIIVIVGINTILGFYQEYKASQALRVLKSYIISYAKVIRDGRDQVIRSSELVPGDLIVLEPGDIVPADMRLIEDSGLFIDEALLTGESVAVNKISNALQKTPKQLFTASNYAFGGTTVVAGKGRGIILAIGMATSLGQITRLMTETVRKSSFAKGIDRFSQVIVWVVVAVTMVAVFIANSLIKHHSLFDPELLIFAISLIVAVIPEMLPTITTFSLAQGAVRLAQHKVIVKRLTAIEDLGSINILCTDKTGTLTENVLTVSEIYGKSPQETLFYAALATSPNSSLNKKHVGASFDAAILQKISEEDRARAATYNLVNILPFEPERRRSSTLVEHEGKEFLIVRGAYEDILKESFGITPEAYEEITQWVAQRGAQGERVVAIASKEVTDKNVSDLKQLESDLIFHGVISFIDPIKKTSFDAIKQARMLGLKIKILTGDSPEVAGAVAHRIELTSYMQEIMNGDYFATLSEEEKEKAVYAYSVFSRITPQQKYEIIKILQKKYEVGYLGDGINDAPALKLANVAIAVKDAADVAQEAADIILLKKSLFVIVQGIQEGRRIFANTVKYLKTTIVANIGHFYAIILASLFLDFMPLMPLQLLLLNIITDFPMIAIATDAVDEDQLQTPRQYNIREIILFAMALSPVSTIFDFVIFRHFYHQPIAVLQTNWFIGVVITELLLIFSLRTHKIFFKASRPSWILLGVITLACMIALALPYTYVGQHFFNFLPPSGSDLVWVLGIGIAYFCAIEGVKLVYYNGVANATKKATR